MEKHQIFNSIITFVENERWKYSFLLNRNTRIVQDLKIDGDDAVEFMEKFVSTFNIDYSEFQFGNYFSPEGLNLFSVIISFFKKKQIIKKTLTLGDLERAVIIGKIK